MERTDTAIIGAGLYGLSIAAHLQARGLEYRCFGEPMASWRNWMPTGMLLRSEAHASSLWDLERCFTLAAYCRDKGITYRPSGPPLPIGLFLSYCDWFIDQAALTVQKVQVRRVYKERDIFGLELEDGERLFANRVVIATGHRYFRYIPPMLRSMSTKLVSHSCGLETAALLHEQGTKVTIVVRKPLIKWNPVNDGIRSRMENLVYPESGLGFGWRRLVQSELPNLFPFIPWQHRVAIGIRALGPSGAWWLRNRIDGRIPIYTSREIDSCEQRKDMLRLRLRNGGDIGELEAEHVIAATGYHPDISQLSFIDAPLLRQLRSFAGFPTLTSGYESSVPGLYFAGILATGTFGPVMRFMFGAKHAAPVIARQLARRPDLSSVSTLPRRLASRDRFHLDHGEVKKSLND